MKTYQWTEEAHLCRGPLEINPLAVHPVDANTKQIRDVHLSVWRILTQNLTFALRLRLLYFSLEDLQLTMTRELC